MGSKGSQTTTQNSTTAPNASAMAAYNDILARAQGVANTPYQPYTGELTAGVNAQQTTGIGNINSASGMAQPYINQAATYANQAAAPISAEDIARYQNPYTQQVVDATQQQFQHSNAMQQQQLNAGAAAQGALGGSGPKIAQTELARQQQAAQAPVIAGLYSQGYGQATQTALAEQQQKAQGAYSLGNLGVSAQGAALQGAGAQIGAGTLQQQTQQQQDTAALNQYMQQIAFPYQQTGWLAGIGSGIGSQMGGTTSGQTTAPAPSPWAGIAGAGLAGVGLLGGTGAFGASGWLGSMFRSDGGRVPHRAEGGPIYPGVPGAAGIPSIQIVHGRGVPQMSAPQPPQQQQTDVSKMASSAIDIAKMLKGSNNPGTQSPAATTESPGVTDPLPMIGSHGDMPVPTFMAHGGLVNGETGGIYVPRGYAQGGDPNSLAFNPAPISSEAFVPGASFGNRFDASYDAIPRSEPQADTFSDRFGNLPDPIDLTREHVDPRNIGKVLRSAEGLQNQRVVESAPTLPPTSEPAIPVVQQQPDPELPPEITAGSSRPTEAPATPAMAYSADPNARAIPPATDAPAESEEGVGQSTTSGPNGLWMPLLSAGLGMMASRSPFLANAIGEGGLAGVNTYAQQQKLTAETADKAKNRAIQEKHVNLEAQKLSQQASQFARQLAETTRQHDLAASKPIVTEDEYGRKSYWLRGPDGKMRQFDPKTGDAQKPDAAAPSSSIQARPMSQAAQQDDDSLLPVNAKPTQANVNIGTMNDPMEAQYNPEVLRNEPEQIANTVKAIAEGRRKMPPQGRNNPRNQRISDLVMQYNPDWDETAFARRQQTATDFSKGVAARNLTATKTLAGHLESLYNSSMKLQNGRWTMLTKGQQALAGQTPLMGKEYEDAVKDYETKMKAVADEAAKVFAGTQSALADREEWTKKFDVTHSLNRQMAAIRGVVDLVDSRLLALSDQYNRGMKTSHQPSDLIEKKYRDIFDRMRNASDKPATPPAAAPAAPSVATPAAPAQTSDADRQALDWANANPNDPRAAAIKKKLGVQ